MPLLPVALFLALFLAKRHAVPRVRESSCISLSMEFRLRKLQVLVGVLFASTGSEAESYGFAGFHDT